MTAKKRTPAPAEASLPRPCCDTVMQMQPRTRVQHYAQRIARQQRVLNISAALAVAVSGIFVTVGFLEKPVVWRVQVISIVAAAIFAVVPLLHRFGELVAPLTFICSAYVVLFINCWNTGTGTGVEFFFLVAACLVVLQLGIEHIALAGTLAAVGAGLIITLEFLVPRNTGLQPTWAQPVAFVLTTISACVMVVVTLWYALREILRAEAVMEVEYDRSEALLANIMPASIAARLKDRANNIIADRYDDASVLFADIADFTEKASDIAPDKLIRFLNRLYGDFDALVDKYGLEKIKVSGDSYMVVSGVPWPRRDHVEALADLALDMADTANRLKDSHGNAVPLRIGLASGPVVAGVVGSRRFFYDVWGDAVNVASRMESSDPVGRIQVPEPVYERLKKDFVLEQRGEVTVKGKGVMRTWYLVGRKPGTASGGLPAEAPQTAVV